jgi:hypothetical protein
MLLAKVKVKEIWQPGRGKPSGYITTLMELADWFCMRSNSAEVKGLLYKLEVAGSNLSPSDDFFFPSECNTLLD